MSRIQCIVWDLKGRITWRWGDISLCERPVWLVSFNFWKLTSDNTLISLLTYVNQIAMHWCHWHACSFKENLSFFFSRTSTGNFILKYFVGLPVCLWSPGPRGTQEGRQDTCLPVGAVGVISSPLHPALTHPPNPRTHAVTQCSPHSRWVLRGVIDNILKNENDILGGGGIR